MSKAYCSSILGHRCRKISISSIVCIWKEKISCSCTPRLRDHLEMRSKCSRRSEALTVAAQRLGRYEPQYVITYFTDPKIHCESGRTRRAAVLICLFEGENGDIRVILTKRSPNLSSHPGEVSLPGGKWEEGDENDADTALREAKEEIGLDPSVVEVVTVLQPLYSRHSVAVIPVIGIIWDKNDFNPVANAAEVESVFDAPLEMFLKNENRREEKIEGRGNEYLLHFFDYQAEKRSYTIWAFTAAVLIKVASIVYQRPPAFEEHRPKFWSGSRL